MGESYYETNTRIAVDQRLTDSSDLLKGTRQALREVEVKHWGNELIRASQEAQKAISRFADQVRLAAGRQEVAKAKATLEKWEGKL